MSWIRWLFILCLVVLLHVGLATLWIFKSPFLPKSPAPMEVELVTLTPDVSASSEQAAVSKPLSHVAKPVQNSASVPEKPAVKIKPVVKSDAVMPIKEKKTQEKPPPMKRKSVEEIPEKVVPKLAPTNPIQSSQSLKTDKPVADVGKNREIHPEVGKTGSPRALSRPQPVYPDRARRLGQEGYVKVRYDIDADGRVINVEIIQSAPAGIFERDVKRAMRQWRYEKQPARGYTTEIYFKLDGSVSQS